VPTSLIGFHAGKKRDHKEGSIKGKDAFKETIDLVHWQGVDLWFLNFTIFQDDRR